MLLPPVGPLVGTHVRLEPLTEAHIPGLTSAGATNRQTFGFTAVPDGDQATGGYVHGLLAAREAGDAIPFVQIRQADNMVVGATRYLSPRFRAGASLPFVVEIGGTWLAQDAQRSGINTEAKLLLLTQAFDRWEVERVELKTDARNDRSRVAIARIGAAFEGVLRSWQPSSALGEAGMLRDTAMFSILRAEWPDVQAAVRARLDLATA